jgi:hypothetical protein
MSSPTPQSSGREVVSVHRSGSPTRRWTFAAGALAAALLFTPAAARAATVQVDAATGSDTPTCGVGPAGPCQTLSHAVRDRAADGDTVQVAAGSYPVGAAGLVIRKRLTLLGAQAGVDARTRTPGGAGESVITGGPTFGLLYILAGGSGSTIDGFTVTGNSGNNNVSGAGILIGGFSDGGGYRIINNILTHNAVGLYFAAAGAATTISRNLLDSNTQPGDPVAGTAIYSEQARDVTISDNRFTGNDASLILHAASGGSDVAFSGNQATGEGGIIFAHINGLTVSDNTITGGSGSAVTLGGDGLSDAKVLRNTITGKTGDRAAGVRLTNFGAPSADQNDNVTIAQNTLVGATSSDGAEGNGVWIRPQGAQGQVTITANRIIDSSGAGLRNEDPDADVDAAGNWWGCNSGPGASGCDTVIGRDGGGEPAFTPWLLLSLTATPAQIAAGGGATMLADLANRSTGGMASGPFFHSGQATFGSAPAGTHTPPSAPLDANLKASSAFTAGAAPTELRTTVDHQTVRIAITEPPAPDVVPDVTPDDTTLSPGEVVGAIVTIANQGNATARRTRACLRVSAKLKRSGRACRTIARLRPGQSVAYRVLARAKSNACRGRLAYRLTVQVGGRRAQVRRALGRLLAGACSNAPCPTITRARASGPGGQPAEERRTRPRARAAC